MKLGLVILDTLRYDVASEQMEKIWDLADHRFERMYSTSRWTVAAHSSLFTGLYPMESGTHKFNHHLNTEKPTLSERLSNAGFDTHLYSNNPYIDSFFNFDRGFNVCQRGPACRGRPNQKRIDLDWPELFSEVGDGPLRYLQAVRKVIQSDAPTLPALRSGIEFVVRPTMEEATFETNDVNWFFDTVDREGFREKTDIFMYGNLMPCHYPYSPPSEYRNREPYNEIPPAKLSMDRGLDQDQHERQWDCYQGAARYLDDQLEDLVNLCDWDALFIISDHGELFGEHGLRLHNYGVYNELIHVPAVAIGDMVPSGTTTSLTSILDIHETLIRLAGLESHERDRGMNLFEDSVRDYVYSESVGIDNPYMPESWNEPQYTVITEKGSLIHDKDGTSCEPDDDEIEQKLREIADELRNEWRLNDIESDNSTVPNEIDERLTALGYK